MQRINDSSAWTIAASVCAACLAGLLTVAFAMKPVKPVADFSRMEKRLRAQEAAGEVTFVGLDQTCPEYSQSLMADELGLCWAD